MPDRRLVPLTVRRRPHIGDRVTIGYGHDTYPGQSGTVAEVRASRIDPDVVMVRVAFETWVLEEELR